MGWLKKVAAQSYLQGRCAPEFAAAAQRWANAFWWPLITAAIVWWFAGWKWALVPLAGAAWCAFQSVSATSIQKHLEYFDGGSN